ncbi:hypothetical protein BH10PAT3_BH10PAT3_4280 [soil metagenome]
MICIYCGNETEVTNSRANARTPSVWRRRACKACDAQFTTVELPDYAKALVVTGLNKKHIYPFSRDKLLISLYQAVGHRKDALVSATALTGTVIGRLLSKKYVINGALSTKDISCVAYQALKRFDPLAAATYKAYHQVALRAE